MKQGFGYQRDLGDHRDFKFEYSARAALPSKVDLRNICPPIYNQGSLGSCTAQAACGAIQTLMPLHPDPDFLPSRLFLYYNTRVIQGSVNHDSGASLRNTIKAAANTGICDEGSWPYLISKFSNKPTLSSYKFAKQNVIDRYERVPQALTGIKAALADDYPVVFGFSVYESFMTKKTSDSGMCPYPKNSERQVGGHAVMLCGYDDANKKFLVRNSWGLSWGINGYFYMGYDYALNPDLANDFWVIKVI